MAFGRVTHGHGAPKKAGASAPSRLVSGVGLNFFNDENYENKLRVKNVLKGGSAEQFGDIRVGDVVLSVENINVERMNVSELKNVLRGDAGKSVTMTFLRPSDDENGPSSYEVKLIRGYAEIALQEEKSRMQLAIEETRKRLTHCKVEEQTLMSEKMHLLQLSQMNAEQLRRMSADNAQVQEQSKVQAAAIEELRGWKSRENKAAEEAELSARIATYETERAKLTKLLSEAEIEIVKAVGQLDSFQSSTLELDQLCKEEQNRRDAIERRIKHIEQNGGASLRQGVLVRESREQLKKNLQDKVEQLQMSLGEAQQQRKAQEKIRENSHLEEAASEEALHTAQKQNQEVQVSIREAEKMLRKAEGERLEALSKYEALTLEFGRCKSQIQVREQLILDLQGRIEDDYEKWNMALTSAQAQRKQDQERFIVIEDEKTASLRKLMDERQALASKVKDLLENSTMNDLLKQKEESDTRLANQRALNVRLGEKKMATEDQIKRLELQCSRHEIQVLQSNQRGVEHETNLSTQRFQSMEAELDRQVQKDQVRVDITMQMQEEHAQDLATLQKQLEELHQSQIDGIEAKRKIDEDVQRSADALRQLREVEASRMSRIETFSQERVKLLDSFNELLLLHDEFRRNVEGARQPVAQASNFYHRQVAAVAESFSPAGFGVGDADPMFSRQADFERSAPPPPPPEPSPAAFAERPDQSFVSLTSSRLQGGHTTLRSNAHQMMETTTRPTMKSVVISNATNQIPMVSSSYPVVRNKVIAGPTTYHQVERIMPAERIVAPLQYSDVREYAPRDPREFVSTVREYRPSEINPGMRYETMA